MSTNFKKQIVQGIPSELPEVKVYDSAINHAPKRKDILNKEEKKLALRNALRYFDKKHHPVLAKEFATSSDIVKEIKKSFSELNLIRHNNSIEKELLNGNSKKKKFNYC